MNNMRRPAYLKERNGPACQPPPSSGYYRAWGNLERKDTGEESHEGNEALGGGECGGSVGSTGGGTGIADRSADEISGALSLNGSPEGGLNTHERRVVEAGGVRTGGFVAEVDDENLLEAGRAQGGGGHVRIVSEEEDVFRGECRRAGVSLAVTQHGLGAVRSGSSSGGRVAGRVAGGSSAPVAHGILCADGLLERKGDV